MIAELYNYDVFPKVVKAGQKTLITIKPLGRHAKLKAGQDYELTLSATDQGMYYYPEWQLQDTFTVKADADNCLRFEYFFKSEQEYIINITDPAVKFGIYALDSDLWGRYPFRGDMHLHSCCSDGKEAPEMVAANYRGAGYDFMAVTDHRKYYPSLEAIETFKDVAPSFCLVPGEEVQLPLTDIHIINFGGHFSVNALIDGNENQKDKGDDPSVRSDNGVCPPVMSREKYEDTLKAMALPRFDNDNANTSFAACCWAFDRIREAGGLAVFCHPYWKRKFAYHVPEVFVTKMLAEHPFDAFEVLGGERYYEQNGFQTARYYEEQAKGNVFPIVGSTDSHGSTEHNLGGFICSTIVFAPENTRESLISSVKDFYSVAVDTISREFRLVGSLRLQRYACFLMNRFYPLHDRLCAIEGEYMRAYACGDDKAKAKLDLIANDVKDLFPKYFAI